MVIGIERIPHVMVNSKRVAFTVAFVAVSAALTAQGILQGASQSTSVKRFSDGSTVTGSSSALMRSEEGVTMTVLTSDLEAGGTYTVWWVIFNSPENCVNAAEPPRCGPADTAPARRSIVGASVLYGTGQVLRANGRGNFAARLLVGDTSGARFGPGLLNPMGAEVHLVVRGHGQPIPGQTDDQIGAFDGGCDVNTCVDEQFAQHVPFIDETSERLAAIKSLLDRLALAHSLLAP